MQSSKITNTIMGCVSKRFFSNGKDQEELLTKV